MTKDATIHHSETVTPLYPPSWVDRFTDWVKRLPGPSWLFYLGLWLALFLLINALKWLDGSQPLGTIEPLLALGAALAIYFPAMMHYLNGAASTALRTFRPVLAVSEAEYKRLHYQLTTLPARGAWLASGIGITMTVLYMLFRPTAMPDYITSLPVAVLDLGFFICALTTLGALIYHTIHQLTTVSRIHAAATHINLFQLDPLYAFSGLAARTVLGYILIVDTTFLFIREVMSEEANDPEVIGVLTLIVLLAVVTFVLPLLGMHRRMVEEKARLEAEANHRLEAAIAELHRRVDDAEFNDMTELYRAIAGLEIERDVLARISTWPWQPGTLRIMISPVLLPVAVWLIQRLLERFAGW
ncbi:MAG: hypothetical protein ACE5I2_00460 [Anaerolineae bacterium]